MGGLKGGDTKPPYKHLLLIISVVHLQDNSSSIIRSVMAAANSFRSTKALLLMVILLSLVYDGKGLIDDDDLMMENIQKLQKEAARKKAVNKMEKVYVGVTKKLLPLLDYVTEWIKKVLPDPYLLDMLEESKNIVKEHLLILEQNLRYEAAIIGDNKRKLSFLEEIVSNLTQGVN